MKKSIIILIAEDDPEDQLLTIEALEESKLVNTVHFVENGEDLILYLENKGRFEDKIKYPKPGIILLDLNMPKMDGREALQIIKSKEMLRMIPIVILTTSKAEEDILRSYDLGVSSFISKPVTFNALVEIMKTLGKYWLEIVELPIRER